MAQYSAQMTLAEIEEEEKRIEEERKRLQKLREIRASLIMLQARERQIPGDEDILERCEGKPDKPGSLHEFVKEMWSVLEPATEFKDGMALHAMCLHLECITYGKIQKFLGNVPPGSMKSLLVDVFWPAWEWGPARMPHLRYVCFSYSASLTERDNEKFRDLIISTKYQRLWGDRFKLKKIGAVKVTNDKTGSKLATSIGGVGTGERGDRVILDDPHSVKEGESQIKREGAVEWFRSSMLNRLNDMHKSAIVVIMQRVHEADVSGCILELKMDFVHLFIENELTKRCRTVDPKTKKTIWVDPRTRENQLYWPERMSREETQKLKKNIGPYAYAGQYQQAPRPKGGGIITEEGWQIWKEDETPEMEFVLASLDGAYTEKETNDPSGVTIWGVWREPVTRQPQVLLMHAFSDRLRFNDLINKTIKVCRQFHVDRLIIENKASGASLYQEMTRLFRMEVGCQLVNPKGDKVSRAYAVQHLFGAFDETSKGPDGKPVWIPGMVWRVQRSCTDKVVDEMASLGVRGGGKHDDLADSTTQALKFMRDCGWVLMPNEGVGDDPMSHYGQALAQEDDLPYDV